MSFKYETQHDSPNFTPGSKAPATWGRPYIVTAIAIHWWGDPNTNPTYEGVISTLVNPNRGASAHFVATGTGRRVAQLVDLSNASWATNSANPWTVSIECDPRCRDEDYDVVAELIANIRSVYGDIPLVPHKQFVATACPGNYDLERLDRIARTKDGSGEWGDVKNKVQVARAEVEQAYLDLLKRKADEPGLQSWLNSGLDINGIRSGIQSSPEYKALQELLAAVPKPPVVPEETPSEPIQEPPKVPVEPEQPVTPETPKTPTRSLRELLIAIANWIIKFWNMK